MKMDNYSQIVAYTRTQIVARVAMEQDYKHGDYLVFTLEDAHMYGVDYAWIYFDPETKTVYAENQNRDDINPFQVDRVFVVTKFAAQCISANELKGLATSLKHNAAISLLKENQTEK